jgi:hypothetical protein
MENFWRRRGLVEGAQKVTPSTPPLKLVYMLAYMWPSTTIARTDVVRRWGGFYENGCRYAEDAYLWLKVLLNETVYFHFAPLANLHREDSGLSANLTGVRPVEPFLLNPEPVFEHCPEELRNLLENFLALRACKTASVLGYWGQHRKARELVSKFVSMRHWHNPYFVTALAGCTPLGGLAGLAFRTVKDRGRAKPA